MLHRNIDVIVIAKSMSPADLPGPGLPRQGNAVPRERRRPPVARRIGLLLAEAWDVLAASDPGLLRLLLAARGVVSVTLASLMAVGLGRLLHEPPVVFAAGVVISLIGPFVMRDPTARQRRTTLLLLLLPATACTVMCALLHDQEPGGEAFFLMLLFVGTLLQARDPRAVGLGLVAVVMTYIGLYLELPVATLPLQCLGLVTGATAAAVSCFVLLPLRPASTLRRAVRSVQRRAARVLREARETPAPGKRAQAVQRHLMRLNEAALAAEDQLEVIDEHARIALRLHLFGLEQAVTRLLALLASDQIQGRAMAKLSVAEARLRHGRKKAGTPNAQGRAPALLHDALDALTAESSQLMQAASRVAADAGRDPEPARTVRGPLAWRMAIQVTLASVLAMAGGMALSPQRWFWAVVSVYIVFLNARSRGETIQRGMHRMAGTFAGLFVGLAAAGLSSGDACAECAIMLVAVFSLYYFYAVSYAIAIFAVTILLGMIYGMLGSPLEAVLTLRLEETAIGVAAAVLASAFVMPIRTRHQVSLSGNAVLRAMQDVVRLSRQAMDRPHGGGHGDLPLVEAVRRLDRQIVDLRRSLKPLTMGRTFSRRGRSARPVTAILACAECARHLAAASRLPHDGDAASLADAADLVEARIGAMLNAGPPPPVEGPAGGGGSVRTALSNLDTALVALADRLKGSVLEAFAVD
jgi:uncharacterized membrane protein YccC